MRTRIYNTGHQWTMLRSNFDIIMARDDAANFEIEQK